MRSYVLFFTILPCRHEPPLTSEALGWGLMFLPLYGEVIAFDKPPRSGLAVASGSRPRITAGRSVGFLFDNSFVICRNHGARGRSHAAGPEKLCREPGGESHHGQADGKEKEPSQQYKGDWNNYDRKHDQHGPFPPIERSRLPARPTMLELHTHFLEIGTKDRRRKDRGNFWPTGE